MPSEIVQTLQPAAGNHQKGMGLMALTGRRPAEIFFSASFSLPREKLPYPALLFDGQLKNPPSSIETDRKLTELAKSAISPVGD